MFMVCSPCFVHQWLFEPVCSRKYVVGHAWRLRGIRHGSARRLLDNIGFYRPTLGALITFGRARLPCSGAPRRASPAVHSTIEKPPPSMRLSRYFLPVMK